jgi:hypothetical protein
MDGRVDLRDDVPRDVHLSAAPDEQLGHDRSPVADSCKLEIVDLPAPPALAVDDLVIQQAEAEVDRPAHPCPRFVRRRSGTAVTAIRRITNR